MLIFYFSKINPQNLNMNNLFRVWLVASENIWANVFIVIFVKSRFRPMRRIARSTTRASRISPIGLSTMPNTKVRKTHALISNFWLCSIRTSLSSFLLNRFGNNLVRRAREKTLSEISQLGLLCFWRTLSKFASNDGWNRPSREFVSNRWVKVFIRIIIITRG